MDKQTLFVDVDRTIWDFTTPFCEAMTRLSGGIPYLPEEETYWERPYDFHDGEIYKQAFDEVLHPDRVKDRPGLFEGAKEVVEALSADYEIHFLTQNARADQMFVPLNMWLTDQFACDFTLTLLFPGGSKLEVMEAYDTFGIIDDRPLALEEAVENGYFAATKRYPFNRESREFYPQIVAFDEWSELPALLPQLVK
jgi:5'(3')-deoxyribonucleotidase